MNSVKTFIEIGQKKTFAGAMDWPGWCRSGRDEKSAIQALVDHEPRYAQIIQAKGIEFQVPGEGSGFTILERHAGNATTDFGAPNVILEADRAPIAQVEFERFKIILQACWQAFDSAVEQATDRDLRKGPRGGGRNLEVILKHVLGADQAYLARLAWKQKRKVGGNPVQDLSQMRQAILNALEASVNGDLPEQGPRGGSLWPPRYFIRRVAWHVVDHIWEIEDRMV